MSGLRLNPLFSELPLGAITGTISMPESAPGALDPFKGVEAEKKALSRADSRAAELLGRGYTEVDKTGELSVGQRVRHIGEQYPSAMWKGTAVIERIFTRTHSKDVEVIVRRDKPKWGPNDTHGFWADYHTAPTITPEPTTTEGNHEH